MDRYTLGDAIRRAFLRHGNNSWCSIADDVLFEFGLTTKPSLLLQTERNKTNTIKNGAKK